MNRRLELDFYGTYFVVFGGSYYNAPEAHYTVFIGKTELECDIHVKDVYDPYEVVDAIKRVIVQLYKGKKVFIGCSSGIHKSGIFLTFMAAIMLQINPRLHEILAGDASLYVEKNYLGKTAFSEHEYVSHTDYSYCSSVIHFLYTYPLLRFLPEPVILWLFR